MAFLVQNDDGTIDDANAYITVAEYREYWANRGIDTTSDADETVEALIVNATQYLDVRYDYNGIEVNGRDQTTAFPRLYLKDSFCRTVEGVPREVKQACCEYSNKAKSQTLSNTYSASEQSVTKQRERVEGAVDTEYEYSGSMINSSTWNIYQIADNIMLNSGFVVDNMVMGRA